MRYINSILALVAGIVWLCLSTSTSAERQRALDSSCPAHPRVIRYPAGMGGPHPAVCNPTGRMWR